jgi:hypothetical protein
MPATAHDSVCHPPRPDAAAQPPTTSGRGGFRAPRCCFRARPLALPESPGRVPLRPPCLGRAGAGRRGRRCAGACAALQAQRRSARSPCACPMSPARAPVLVWLAGGWRSRHADGPAEDTQRGRARRRPAASRGARRGCRVRPPNAVAWAGLRLRRRVCDALRCCCDVGRAMSARPPGCVVTSSSSSAAAAAARAPPPAERPPWPGRPPAPALRPRRRRCARAVDAAPAPAPCNSRRRPRCSGPRRAWSPVLIGPPPRPSGLKAGPLHPPAARQSPRRVSLLSAAPPVRKPPASATPSARQPPSPLPRVAHCRPPAEPWLALLYAPVPPTPSRWSQAPDRSSSSTSPPTTSLHISP